MKLSDYCLQFRSYPEKVTENLFSGKLPILVMLDGWSFHTKVRNKFKLPFDEEYQDAMVESTKELFRVFPDIKFGYTQSDEVSLLILPNINTPMFELRYVKFMSLISATFTAKFNEIMIKRQLKTDPELKNPVTNYQFDCKVWEVPTMTDALTWFLYRQKDCIRNSVSQVAQSHFKPSELNNKNVDDMKGMLFGIGDPWEYYPVRFQRGQILFKKTTLVEIPEELRQWPSNKGKTHVERSIITNEPSSIFESEEDMNKILDKFLYSCSDQTSDYYIKMYEAEKKLEPTEEFDFDEFNEL